MMVSSVHNVCKKGYYIAIISTMVETSNPLAELTPAFELIGAVKEQFVIISDMWETKPDAPKNGIYVSNSFTP